MYTTKEFPILTINGKATNFVEVNNNELTISGKDIITFKNNKWFVNNVWQGEGACCSVAANEEDIVNREVFNNVFEEIKDNEPSL